VLLVVGSLWVLTWVADWNERLAQMEFLVKEEEYKRIDAEEKYAMLEHEMIQQAMEMDEKMAEMERMYMYRLLDEVFPTPRTPFSSTPLLSRRCGVVTLSHCRIVLSCYGRIVLVVFGRVVGQC
jgi:hypothetical protein